LGGDAVNVFKKIMKVFLILLGGQMVLGGGICAVVDAGFLLSGGGTMAALFLVISLAVALAGWGLYKFSLTLGKVSGEKIGTGKRPDSETSD
jgi:hypothetical protein